MKYVTHLFMWDRIVADNIVILSLFACMSLGGYLIFRVIWAIGCVQVFTVILLIFSLEILSFGVSLLL